MTQFNPHVDIAKCIAGTVVYRPGGTYGPRLYSEIQLLLLHSGSMKVDIDGKSHKVKAGNVIMLLPGQNVTIHFDEKIDSWHRWVSLTPETNTSVKEINEQLSKLPLISPIPLALNQLVDLMLTLKRWDQTEHNNLQITLGLAALQMYEADSLDRSTLTKHPAIVTVKSFINDRYHQELTLADFAESANISQSHLVRLFRLHEKISPIQYLWRCRVERGLELLRTTGLSVGEIAEQCGFKTPFHFSRLVKKQTGNTPTEYRNQFWNGEQHIT